MFECGIEGFEGVVGVVGLFEADGHEARAGVEGVCDPVGGLDVEVDGDLGGGLGGSEGGESGEAGPDLLEEGVEEQPADAEPAVGRADAEGEDADGGRGGGGEPGGDGADDIERDRLAAGEGRGDVVWGQMAMVVGRAARERHR